MNFSTTESTEDTEKKEMDPLTCGIIGAAIDVHRALGSVPKRGSVDFWVLLSRF